MTTYSLTVGSETDIYFTKISIIKEIGELGSFEATIPYSLIPSISRGDNVIIYRDDVAIFKGIYEKIEREMSSDGSTVTISGRHTKVKIWRKWQERYSDLNGFWTGYYPNKVISFLLRPSFSEYEPKNNYTRIGWGLNPYPDDDTKRWIVTASDYDDEVRRPANVANRLDTVGWESDNNQSTSSWIKVDLRETKNITAVRIENWTTRETEFVRNYKIETSTDDENWTQVATKTKNRAINIVESWAPANARYIKISATASFAKKWSISNIYVYESGGTITGISEGTITEHLPFNSSLVTTNVSSGQPNVAVKEGWKFNPDDKVIVGDDDSEGEYEIESVSENTLTLKTNASANYTTAKNAFVTNYYSYAKIDMDYIRRSEGIDKIVSMMMTDSVPWIWDVTDDGVVNVGLQIGTDKSGTISFSLGTNMIKSNSTVDGFSQIDKVLVIGKGKEDDQDRTASGWLGTGEYEHIEIDSSLESPEATRSKGYTLLQQNANGLENERVDIIDTYNTNDWTVDDTITLTDSISGLSDTYRVKRISRTYSTAGETVSIQTTSISPRADKLIAKMIQEIRSQKTSKSFDNKLNIYGDISYLAIIEAELLTLYDDADIVTDVTASNGKYVQITSDIESGNVFRGFGLSLKAGTYIAVFYSKVTDNSSGDDLITIDVYSETYGSALTSLTLSSTDYSASDTFQAVKLIFSLSENYTDIEFRAFDFINGITDWSCDFVGLQTVGDAITDFPYGPPDTPTGLAVTSKSFSLHVTWDANSEADLSEYLLYRDVADNPTTLYTRVKSTSFSDTNVVVGTTYYYRLKASDTSGNISDYSDSANGTPTGSNPSTVPDAPEGFDAEDITTGVTTGSDGGSWAYFIVSIPSVAGAVGYKLRWKLSGSDEWFETLSTTTEVRIDWIIPSSTYLFQVAAYGQMFASSDWAPETPVEKTAATDTTAPEAPTGFSATAIAMGVYLEWTANSESDVTTYKVYKHTSDVFGSASLVGQIKSTYAIYHAATNEYGVTLYFWLTTIDTSGNESDPSSSVNAAPLYVKPLDLSIEQRIWNSNLSIIADATTPDLIKWGAPTLEGSGGTDASITFSDGTSDNINASQHDFNLGVGESVVYYFYWSEGSKTGDDYDLQYSTTYSDAVGDGKGLCAIAQINQNKPSSILTVNGYIPTMGYGFLAAKVIRSEHLITDDAVITNSLQIDNGIITSDHVITVVADKVIFTAEDYLSDLVDSTGASTIIEGGKIKTSTIEVGSFADSAVNRIFGSSDAKTNIEGWMHVSDGTKIDGGDIYTGTVTAAKICVVGVNAVTTDIIPTGEDNFYVDVTEIDGGKIKLSTKQVINDQGTFSVVTDDEGPRVELTTDGIHGYNGVDEDAQFYLLSSDGTAYCGGGSVILDASGISLKGSGGAGINGFGALKMAYDGENKSAIFVDSDLDTYFLNLNDLYVSCDNLQVTDNTTPTPNKLITVFDGDVTLNALTDSSILFKIGAGTALTISSEIIATLSLRSEGAATLGTGIYPWDEIYGEDVYVSIKLIIPNKSEVSPTNNEIWIAS